MRRLLVVPLLTLGLVAGTAQVAVGERHTPDLPVQAAARASAALDAARAALQGKGGEASLALADLQLAYDDLSSGEQRQADAIFARPTSAGGDGEVDYSPTTSYRICRTNICVHYVKTSADAPPSADANSNGHFDWAETTADEMQAVWNKQVGTGAGQLGFRPPAPDGTRGATLGATPLAGNSKLDIYLANLGDQGLYGYCAPEGEHAGNQFRYFGYCVLDDDFAEFAKPGLPSLRVTAAHEFFHAVQFNYDVGEDRWIMEASATWMEERHATAVNDNRQYLDDGQLGVPQRQLDDARGLGMYGNWLFFEFLSQRYDTGIMKRLWTFMDTASGPTKDQYSTQAVSNLLKEKNTSFANVYPLFAASNLMPARVYAEGAAYPAAPVYKGYQLTATGRTVGWQSVTLNHMANLNFRFVPASSLTGTWRLKITVDGPPSATSPGAYAILHLKDGRKFQYKVALNGNGDGSVLTSFSPSTASYVTLTLANASTRFTGCWNSSPYSCAGTPLDNGRVFRFTASAIR